MSDEQRNRAMQEALDSTLEPEAYRKLLVDIEQDTESAASYERLRNVDAALQDTAMQRVPNSLMQGIMERIAQPEALPTAQPLKSTRALAIGLGITAVLAVPLMVGLSLLLLSLFGTGSALSGAAIGMISVVVFLYTLLQSLLISSEAFIMSNPLIVTLVALVPLAWFGLWRIGKTWVTRGGQANE